MVNILKWCHHISKIDVISDIRCNVAYPDNLAEGPLDPQFIIKTDNIRLIIVIKSYNNKNGEIATSKTMQEQELIPTLGILGKNTLNASKSK